MSTLIDQFNNAPGWVLAFAIGAFCLGFFCGVMAYKVRDAGQ